MGNYPDLILFPFSRFCTHHLDMKQQALTYPRRSDCPGGFRSPQSTGTAFRIHPYYGVYFTQLPSLQPRLFLSCNSLYTIFKVLPILGFCFTTDVRILASHSYALTRSYNKQNPCYMKILSQKCQARDQKVIAVSLREALRVRFHEGLCAEFISAL